MVPSLFQFDQDDGVSAVIGVILMVAITVAIAATVYIWVGGFDTGAGETESASATARGLDKDSNNKVDYIRVTLASGEKAPFEATEVTGEIVSPGGSVFNNLCETPDWTTNAQTCTEPFSGIDEWGVGTSLFFPCQASGDHGVTIAVVGTVILDNQVRCGEVAPS